MIDIETLLVHHPTLTVGEYFKMFPLPDTPPVEKPKSELSKQLEVQVLTYQSAINSIEKEEEVITISEPDKPLPKKNTVRHDRIANEKIYGKFRIQKIVPNIPRLSY